MWHDKQRGSWNIESSTKYIIMIRSHKNSNAPHKVKTWMYWCAEKGDWIEANDLISIKSMSDANNSYTKNVSDECNTTTEKNLDEETTIDLNGKTNCHNF